MNFHLFIDFLNCLYIPEVEVATRTNNQERLGIMGFRNQDSFPGTDLAEMAKRQQQRTARCVKILGKGVVKVVHRCDEAKENERLDLSDCQLTQIPDAIFLLMKNVTLHSCNLANNIITKIPPKLAMNFSQIKELNLSNNRISALPSELSACSVLENVDISSNSFVSLPSFLTELPNIKNINARKNYIADVEVEVILANNNLESIDLEENPLNKTTFEELERASRVSSVKISLTARQQEDWEDLSI